MIKLPREVVGLIFELHSNYLEELDNDEHYGSSVIAGCDCGCGGDTMMDSLSSIWEDREEILTRLYNLGYTVEGDDDDDDQEGE